MLLRAFALVISLGCAELLAQAPKEAAKAHVPVLLAGEGFAISGMDGEVQAFGEARSEHAMGGLAALAWLAFEGTEWAARDVGFKCVPVAGIPACGGPKGHGRVALDKATRMGCGRAFQAWIAGSVHEWQRVYGEGVGRSRVEEAFEPFLGKRLSKGDGLPAFDAAWIGEGDLLRTSPAAFLAWLNDAQQVDLVSRCRRTLGSHLFHFKDFVDAEDWWFHGGAQGLTGGAWVAGGNGRIIAVLHAPAIASSADGIARFRAILGLRKK